MNRVKNFALHGNLVWTGENGELYLRPNSYAVCENGRCAGVFEALPDLFVPLPVRELGEALVFPGFADLHLHAPQYRNIGRGMDLELLEWLNTLTFPEEARFADAALACEVYGRLAEELKRGFTVRAALFATVHTEATLVLMEQLEKTGLRTLVGKVNQDSNTPDYLTEGTAESSLRETERWLEAAAGRFRNVSPILTPRFAPSCTEGLMEGLGGLAEAYGLPIQSHLDETPAEVAWVKKLFPAARDYADVYDRAGLLGPDTLMAHCVYLSDAELQLMAERGAVAVHCPTSNTNVRSGLCPVRRLREGGVRVGLGSDISGGHTLDMMAVTRAALETSKNLWRVSEGKYTHLRAAEAFALGTRAGGFFGQTGAFEPGFDFDAVAVDDSFWREPEDDLAARFEKMLYRASTRHITAKYVAGKKLI